MPYQTTQPNNTMNKHKFNIFPEAKPEDYARIRDDIAATGYDSARPIVTYQGGIIDGWNRQRACDELGIQPTYQAFIGSDSDAISFVMSTNKRRNLNSGQWACIAAEADDLLRVIAEEAETERKRKIAEARQDETRQKIAPSQKDENKTATKAAELFNTNRTYVNQAVKMKEKAPEVFEKVKAGKMTMQDANKAVRAIPVDPWMDDERERREAVERGESVIANQQRDKNLIQWADQNGKLARVDRSSMFGNPFELEKDGDREFVCDAYRDHYLPHKRSIRDAIPSLKGKVLVCHCYPLRCHAMELAAMANGTR